LQFVLFWYFGFCWFVVCILPRSRFLIQIHCTTRTTTHQQQLRHAVGTIAIFCLHHRSSKHQDGDRSQ
jgi:hypothetical protein